MGSMYVIARSWMLDALQWFYSLLVCGMQRETMSTQLVSELMQT
jgi:hypothetical protein